MNFDWRGKRVLVVGDAMLDIYEQAEPRSGGERPLTVVNRVCLPGGAAHAARIASCLGAEVTLAGVVGSDSEASQLQRGLRGLDSRLICDSSRPTTTKTRTAWSGRGFVRRDCESTEPISVPIAQHVVHAMRPPFAGWDAILLSDYGKGVLADASVRAAAQTAPVVVLDPKHELKAFAGVGYATPNEREVCTITHNPIGMGTVKASREAVALLGGATVITTMGGVGALIATPKGVLAAPTVALQGIDAVGAGDAFAAGFTLAKAGGAGDYTAVMFAHSVAGRVLRSGRFACLPDEDEAVADYQALAREIAACP